jgi:argininosuccinate synthase
MSAPKKVVLAYSGGLDTSIILKWLQTEYGCEVVTFTADLGQGEELEPARQKAILLGISCFRCSGPMRFTRGFTCWAPRSRGR